MKRASLFNPSAAIVIALLVSLPVKASAGVRDLEGKSVRMSVREVAHKLEENKPSVSERTVDMIREVVEREVVTGQRMKLTTSRSVREDARLDVRYGFMRHVEPNRQTGRLDTKHLYALVVVQLRVLGTRNGEDFYCLEAEADAHDRSQAFRLHDLQIDTHAAFVRAANSAAQEISEKLSHPRFISFCGRDRSEKGEAR